MRKLLLVATVLACSCSKGTSNRLGGLIADVALASGAQATCLEVRVADRDGNTLGTSSPVAFSGRRALRIGIGSEGYPRDVVVSATPLWSANGCTGAKPNGPAVVHDASFPDRDVTEVNFVIERPGIGVDADQDGFVGLIAGGPDCNDGDAAAFPGAPESCSTLGDLDCNGLGGCADPQCSAVSGCAQPASQLAFTTPAVTVDTNTCSGTLTVESRDPSGTPAPLAAGTPVVLAATPPAGVQFFSDSMCADAVTQVTQPALASRFTFYFQAAMTGPLGVTASSGTLTPATQTETVRPPGASVLAFANNAHIVTAGSCSPPVVIEARDSTGTARMVLADLMVNLSVTPAAAVTFHPDASCTTAAITTAIIASGQSSVTVYVKGLTAGMHQLDAAAAGFTSAMQGVTVNAGAPTQLAFTTTTQGIAVNTCSRIAQVRAEDSRGNPAALAGPIMVDLTESGVAGFSFHSDPACGATATQVPLAAAAGSLATFYFKGTTVGAAMVRAGVAGNALSPATQTENIGVGPPNRLAFTTPVHTVVAGACSPMVTVEVRDSANNATNPPAAIAVGLAGTPVAGFSLYTDSSCNSALTGSLMLNGSPSASFWFRAQRTPTERIDATASGLTGAAQTHVITPGSARQLNVTTPVQSVVAAACSAPVHIEAVDQFGNLVPLMNLPVGYSSSASGAAFFSAAAGCGSGAPGTVTTLDGGFDFRFTGLIAGPLPLTVSSGTLLPAGQIETIVTGPAAVLVIPPPARTQFANQCSPSALSVVTHDSAGNVANVTGGALTVNLASDGGFQFYTSMGCGGGPVGSISIASATSAQSFWFRGTKTGVSTLTASAVAYTPGTQRETITPGDPTVVTITSAPVSTPINVCSTAPVMFETRDAFGNVSPVAMNTTFSVDAGAGLEIFTGPACASPVRGIALATGASSGLFHLKGSIAGAVGVWVGAPGYTAAGDTVTITPGITQLVYTTGAQTKYAGECSGAVTVQTRDAANTPTNVTASTPVMLTANIGFTFFSDAACTLPVTQVAIMSGANSATYYFRGITGGTSTLDATSGVLTPASQAVTIIPAVRTGVCTVASGQSAVQCTLTPALLATSRTFLVFQTAPDSSNANSADTLARCHLLDTTTLECQRGGSPGMNTPLAVYWQTATLPTLVTVQHVNDIACTNNANPTSVPVSSLASISDAFALHSMIATRGSVDDNEQYSVAITGNTNVNLINAPQTCGEGDSHDLQVVKLTGATVSRGTTNLTNSNRQASATGLSAVVAGRTMVMYSWRSGSNANDVCERTVRGSVPDGTSLQFSRAGTNTSGACTDDGTLPVLWERVQLPSGFSVQQVDIQMANGVSSTTGNVNTTVDATRTLVMTGAQTHSGGSLGETELDSAKPLSNYVARFALNAQGTQLTAQRQTTTAAVRYTVFVVELDPR